MSTSAGAIAPDSRQDMLAQATAGTPVPADVLNQLVSFESSWDPSKKNSSSGAAGLGAVLSSTAAKPGFGLAPLPPGATPQEQLNFAARYLAARGRAAGLSEQDWKDPQKVSVALSAYHGPATDANGVNGQNYAQRIMGMSGSATNAAAALGAQPNAAAALGIQSPYGPAMVQQQIGQMEAAQREKDQRTAPIYDEMMQNYRRDQARFDKMADSYQPVPQTPQPVPPQNDPLKGFGSAAGMFAMLASAFTHTPAVNAMNGMAAAINATRDGDQQAYQNAMATWKENTEHAIQNHKLQADDMKAAMEKMQEDLTTGQAMAKAVAAQSEDKIAMRLSELGAWDKLSEHMQASATAAFNMQEKLPEAMASVALTNAQAQMDAAKKSGDPAALAAAQTAMQQAEVQRRVAKGNTSAGDRPGSPAFVTKELYDQIKRDHPGISDADAWTQATEQQRSAGKMDTAYGAREKDAEALALDEFKKQHGRDPGPGDNAEMATLRTQQRATAQGEITGERTLANRTVTLAMASNELDSFGKMAAEASAKVDRTQYPSINSVIEAWQKGTGDKNVIDLAIAVNEVKGAYAQVLVRTGATTDDARRRTDEVIDKAWADGQIGTAIAQMQAVTKEAMKAPAAARAALQGQSGGGAATGGQAPPGGNTPALNEIRRGYRFKGGDPASRSSWEKVSG